MLCVCSKPYISRTCQSRGRRELRSAGSRRACSPRRDERTDERSLVRPATSPTRGWAMGSGHSHGRSRGALASPSLREAGAARRAAPPEEDLRASGGGVRTGYSRLLKRAMERIQNLGTSARPPWHKPWMTKTAGERRAGGRSLRSSPRAGKPSAWRREAVDTASRQEVGGCPAR